MQTVDPEPPIMEGMPNAAASGLAIDGAMGSAAGIASPKKPIRALDTETNTDQQSTTTATEQQTAPATEAQHKR